jgi:hypothetical protein
MTWSLRNEFLPGVDRGVNCSVCHSDLRNARDGTRERVVTTGELIDMEGLFSICESCICEAAALVGMISEEKARALAVKNRQLGQENHNLRKQQAVLDDLRAVLNAG